MNAPELPAGWSNIALFDVVEVLDHLRVPVNRKERAQRHGDVPYYGAAGQVGWIDDHLFDEELVLLGEDGIGFFDAFAPKAYVVEGRSWVNNHAHVLRPRRALVNTRFLLHVLNTFDYRGFANGTTRLKLTKGAMARMQVHLPPRQEQDEIVDHLDRRLAFIESGRRDLNSADRLLGSYRDACRHAAFDLTPEESCAMVALDDVAVVQSGIAKGPSGDGELMEMPYIRTANVQAGYLDLEVMKTISVTAHQALRYRLSVDDVLVLEGGDADKVGRGWIWEDQIAPCLHQNHVFAVRADREALVPRYLAHYLNAPQARRYFAASAKQTTNLASINKTQLKALPIPLPSLDIQQRRIDELERRLAGAAQLETAVAAAERDSRALAYATIIRAVSGAQDGATSRGVRSPHADSDAEKRRVPASAGYS